MTITAILVTAAVAFVLGFLFHGPLFGDVWMKLADIHPTGKEKLKDMIPQMAYNYLANVLSATVLALIIGLIFSSGNPNVGEPTWFRGAVMGFWVWLGFIVTSTSMDVIWMGRKLKLWLFESACSLVVMTVMGAMLAVWR